MQTEAIFDNIAERIQHEISIAQKSIFIAVAWFTNKKLFDELLRKTKAGVNISLIISNDKINVNSSIDYDLININNSKVYKVGNGETDLMHNKFCIIDYCTVITGSYNWSYKAETNFENVIITNNDTQLAEQFIAEFNSIRKQYYPDETKSEIIFPLEKIIKRLEILKNYIILEDIDELKKESLKIKEYDFNSDLNAIINDLNKQEFASAIKKIVDFISKNQQLSIWVDTEIAALKLEIKNLENQLSAFDNEKIELEKYLSEFHHRHTLELGNIIIEILKLRKVKYKADKAKYKEAVADEQQYSENLNEEKNKQIFELTVEEKTELKKNFRKATILCHPDKVSDEFKDAAKNIFIELKTAYDANDLKRVSEIVDDLENGNFFKARSEIISKKNLLQAAIINLHLQIDILEKEIINIKESEIFKLINSINDWNEYFNQTKSKLIHELELLKNELTNNLSSV